MEFVGVIKRVFPFLLTFAAGLFVASFFVAVTSPNFSLNQNRSARGYHDCRRMKLELREFRGEFLRLQRENEELREKLAALEAGEQNISSLPQTPPPKKVTVQVNGAH